MEQSREDFKREEMAYEAEQEAYREANEKSFLVVANYMKYVDALDENEAIEIAKDTMGIEDIENWRVR